MPVIHSDFLLNDKRLRRCSDHAAMAFPFLFSAANSYGRMEVDPRLLISRCFVALDHRPSEEDIPRWFMEYHHAFLVYIYLSPDGTWWAQFDCPRNCLPRSPFARDRSSPPPPDEGYLQWRCRGKTLDSKALQLFCANLRESAHTNTFALAVDVAVVEKDSLSSKEEYSEEEAVQQQKLLASIPISAGPSMDWKEIRFKEFWKVAAWKKIGKAEAQTAWRRIVKSDRQAEELIRTGQEHGPVLVELAAVRGHSVLHPSTWLNKGRYKDSTADLKETLAEAKEIAQRRSTGRESASQSKDPFAGAGYDASKED